MDGYDKLVIVDEFEETYTNEVAVRRACDVMLDYLSNLRRPLPDLADRAVKTAEGYRAGTVGVGALRETYVENSRFLRQTKHAKDLPAGTVPIVRASGALLELLQNPEWGGGAAEALSNFLEWVDEFEKSHPLFEQLLEKYFNKSEP